MCAKLKMVAEYALPGIDKPIGVPDTRCCATCHPCWRKVCPEWPTLKRNWRAIPRRRWRETGVHGSYALNSCLRPFHGGYRPISSETMPLFPLGSQFPSLCKQAFTLGLHTIAPAR